MIFPLNRRRTSLGALLAALALGGTATAADPLAAGFQTPPDSAKPQTWWHWMNGNVTREGITADLEAMQQIGLGGAEMFNADCEIPAGPEKFNSREWHEMFSHAVREANRLGLQLEAHNCAGWSSSGGPWNAVSNGMMRVVTSEVRVTGPTNFSGRLPPPPAKLDYYRDISVIAFPTPAGESASPLPALETTTATNTDVRPLGNGRNKTTVSLPLPTPERPQAVEFDFAQPITPRALVLTPGGGVSGARGKIQASDDGVNFRDCGTLSLPHHPMGPEIFPLGITGRYFRVVFESAAKDAKQIALRGIEFSSRFRVEDFDTKDGDTGGFVESQSNDLHPCGSAGVPRAESVELTGRMKADGHLEWKVPPGAWTILRVGFTPSGRQNHPAPAEGTGLECDKFSRTALDAHWEGFMQKLVDDAGPLAGKTFMGSVIDSYEVGGQNWSANFRREFRRRRGYDPGPFLAAFTGRVVESPEITERFLWDVRRTIADLFAEDYYGHFADLCHQHGLVASIEPYTGPFESLQCGRAADIVMGEFWSGSQGDPSVKLAASVAHIYGKQLVGAESFTAAPGGEHGRWLDDPYALKALGDLEYCAGLNRFVFHRYAMQPWTNRWPGMTMGQWGFHFERTETWWRQGKAWIDYVSRCQFLLQQGRYVADVAYFNGESAPSQMRAGNPGLPAGYQFDAINADVLLHHARMRKGRLTLDGGASYAVLVLPPEDANVTPPLLKRIESLTRAGLAVAGTRPQHSPSLEDYPRCDAEVAALGQALWGACDGKTVREHRLGKGVVSWGEPLTNVLAGLNLEPDFEAAPETAGAGLVYCHRQMPGADIYFVSNQRQRFQAADCSFRISGKRPELWDAQTGTMRPAAVWREEHGRTVVPMQFDAAGSLFVIFRAPAPGDHFVAAEAKPAAAPKAPDLRVTRAVYGYFAASNTLEDVTEKVKELMAKGTREIPANNDFAGGDPAPNMGKELRVEYTVNGSNVIDSAEENESLSLPESAMVTRAVYGKEATNGMAEVTAKLSQRIDNGTLSVRVDNELAGYDPVINAPKELRVDYLLDGAAKHAVAGENDLLMLPPEEEAALPALTVSSAANGDAVVRGFEPGNVALRTAGGKNVAAGIGGLPPATELSGGWKLNFPPNWGAPESVTLEKLISWTEHADAGVKYFSGTATYEKEMEIPGGDFAAGREIWLDLGAVKNFAEVTINGQAMGVLWKPPFRVNITAAARAGRNSLEVKVTNLWPNRLIGDEQLAEDREWKGKRLKAWPDWVRDGKASPTGRLTFTTWHHWTKDDALRESGLLGPVVLRVAQVVTVPLK